MKYFKGKYIQQGGIFDPIFGDFEGMAYLPGNMFWVLNPNSLSKNGSGFNPLEKNHIHHDIPTDGFILEFSKILFLRILLKKL